jgi:BirA family biotin operon repressor/biotin-[acetyl-CoA-carboxylase] ligase
MANSTIETLIGLLADGEFHSGEEIGKHLRVSRTAVWKQLQKLSSLELQIESVKGRGYRLLQPIELLDREAINRGLGKEVASRLTKMDCLFDTDSTNLHAMNAMSEGKVDKGYVCFAEFQRQGKGRRGRRWVSPFGCNIYMSLVWSFEEGATVLEGLSLAVGLAVTRALSEQGMQDVELKWPNDILYQGRKLGGVLIEMTGDPAGHCDIVIGVGINVSMSSQQTPSGQDQIDQPWVAVKECVPDISRNALATSLLSQLLSILPAYPTSGFAAFKEEWQKHDAYFNQQVILSSGENKTHGVARGVNDSGALLLEVNGLIAPIYGGELSLRLNHDS